MKWLFGLGLLLVALVGLWLVPQSRGDREMWQGGGMAGGSSASTPHRSASTPHGDVAPSPSAVGTSGTHHGAAETHRGDVITEIETITGTNDAMALVGRRVDLHVDVQARANDHAFWVGSRDNRLLVVLARDTRDGAQRQHGKPSHHRIVPVRGGQRATVSGVIRRVPQTEQKHAWNLTTEDEHELADRKVYIRADAVSSQGHGSQ